MRIKKIGYKKRTIPKALREQVWIHYQGTRFETKCTVRWCTNQINTFNYHVGHDLPESKGGTLAISNLRPICARCNLSMGSSYTIQEWNQIGAQRPWWHRYICWSSKGLSVESRRNDCA